MKYRIGMAVIAFILAGSFLFAACGGKASISEKQESDSRDRLEYIDILATSQWIMDAGDSDQAEGWEVTEFIPHVADAARLLAMPVPPTGVVFNKDDLYALVASEPEPGPGSHAEYALSKTDLISGSVTRLILDAENLRFGAGEDSSLVDIIREGLPVNTLYIDSFDVEDDEIILFFYFSEYDHIPVSESLECHFLSAKIDMEGNVTDIVNYDNAIPADYLEGSELFWRAPKGLRLKDGRVCMIYYETGKLVLYDSTGKILCSPGKDAPLNGLKYLGKSLKGIPVFSYKPDPVTTEFFYLDDRGMKPVYSGELGNPYCSMDMYGNILMISGTKVVEWNVSNGKRRILYDLSKRNITTNIDRFYPERVTRNSVGDVFVYYTDRESPFLFRLNDLDHPEVTEITVLDDGTGGGSIVQASKAYMRSHPFVNITVEQTENFNDEYEWARRIHDMKSGNAPDLIYARLPRILTLSSAGVLEPLQDIIPQDITENVFEGAMSFCETDGGLYALPGEATVNSIMVPDEYWDRENWTLTEIMDAYEAAKANYNGKMRFLAYPYPTRSLEMLKYLCLFDIEHSEFVDLDEMKCDFDNENFCRMLRFARDNNDLALGYDREIAWSDEDLVGQVRDHEVFIACVTGGFRNFSDDRGALEGLGLHYVCFPSKETVKCIIQCYYGISLCSFSDNKDMAADFLFALLQEEYQQKYWTERVRKDVLRSRVRDAEEIWTYDLDGSLIHPREPAFQISAGARNPLKGRKDGTSFLDEYFMLMDNGVPESSLTELQSIILEETGAFFDGDKTEYEVADIIQERISLYLSERE